MSDCNFKAKEHLIIHDDGQCLFVNGRFGFCCFIPPFPIAQANITHATVNAQTGLFIATKNVFTSLYGRTLSSIGPGNMGP